MGVLIGLSLAAYTAIALLFKAASARTRPAQLVVVAITTVTLLAGVLLNGRALLTVQRPELGWGAALGSCMFIGFWSLLQALALSGEHLTFVLLALSMKTPFIALLSVPIFHEQFSRTKVAAVGLATIALVLWEIGSVIT
jgi:hypothetical protein